MNNTSSRVVIAAGLFCVVSYEAAHPPVPHDKAVLPQHHDHVPEQDRSPVPTRAVYEYMTSSTSDARGFTYVPASLLFRLK